MSVAVYTAEFYPGPIGLEFESDFHNEHVVIKKVLKGGQAIKNLEEIKKGDILASVQGEALDTLDFEEVMNRLRSAKFGLTLELVRPNLKVFQQQQHHRRMSGTAMGSDGGGLARRMSAAGKEIMMTTPTPNGADDDDDDGDDGLSSPSRPPSTRKFRRQSDAKPPSSELAALYFATFEGSGPVGLEFETDFHQEHLVVKKLTKKGQAASFSKGQDCIEEGDILVHVQGKAVDGLSFKDAMQVRHPRQRISRQLTRVPCNTLTGPSRSCCGRASGR